MMSVSSEDPLVGFLYILMRDHLTPGVVEGIMANHVEIGERMSEFSNGWLAQHAIDLAVRLRKELVVP